MTKKRKNRKNELLKEIPKISFKTLNSIDKSKYGDKWDFSKKKEKKVVKIKTESDLDALKLNLSILKNNWTNTSVNIMTKSS